MRSKITKKILNETTQETKDKVIKYSNKLLLCSVINCATCKYVNITADNENHCRMCHNFSNHEPK